MGIYGNSGFDGVYGGYSGGQYIHPNMPQPNPPVYGVARPQPQQPTPFLPPNRGGGRWGGR